VDGKPEGAGRAVGATLPLPTARGNYTPENWVL